MFDTRRGSWGLLARLGGVGFLCSSALCLSVGTAAAASSTDSTVADFGQGTTGPDTYVAQSGDGEVILKPADGEEFSGGPGLPAGWELRDTWNPGGTAAVSGGALQVDGASAGTTQTFGAGRSLEYVATFGGEPNEHVGFGVDFNTQNLWAMFSVRFDGNFYARTNNNGEQLTQLSNSLIGSPHRYRIEWTETEVRYYVDGSLVAQHSVTNFNTPMRPLASDLATNGPNVSVDWAHMSPYSSTGSFHSRVFDAGQAANWETLSWNAVTPPNTSLALSVRTGNTPTPGPSWTGFAPIASSGGSIGANSRYIQYRAQLTSSDPMQTPTLSDVTLDYNTDPDTTSPTIGARSPPPGATDVARNTNVQVQFNELMDPGTIDGLSFRLRRQGSGSDVPANISYTGATATLDPDDDLAPNAVYEVTVAGSVEDANGNALGGDDIWTFTTEPLAFTDTTVGDFGQGTTGPDTYVAQSGEVILKPTVGEEFSDGPGLPPGWSQAPWTGGGGATISGGRLQVDGAYASTDATFGSGRSLEFVATFGAEAFQHVGFNSDNFQTNDTAFAMFSTGNTTSEVRARTDDGPGSETFTTIPGSLIGSPHRYRIEWDAGEVRYYVDGSLVATHPVSVGQNMRLIASDVAIGPNVSLDWLHMSPYPASGSFDSRVFDGGPNADWLALSWNADTPSGTGVAVSVRTGNTSTPDGSWTGFTPIASSGDQIANGNSRYIQYRAELSTSDPTRTPALNDVTIDYAADTIAPNAPQTLTTVPASPANENNPKVKGDAEAGSTVKVYQSNDCTGSVEAQGTAAQFASLGLSADVEDDSDVHFSATATDAAGNTSACSSPVDYTEDTTPPTTQIDTHPSDPSNSANASFDFSGADPGGSGVASFECRLDAGSFAPCTSPQNYTSLDDGSHTFQVRAKDGAGNTDQSPASFTWTIDTTAPTTQIDTHPSDPSNSANASFDFSGADPGGSGVASFECRLDAASFAPCTSPQNYTSLDDGSHTFQVRAKDGAGNTDQSPASFTWTIDTTAPTTQIDTHPSDPSNSANASFDFSGADPGGSGVASFECRLDAGSFAPCTSPQNYTSLDDGSHTFQVRAKDGAGNTDQSPASFTWTIDTTAPTTQIDTHPSDPSNSANASFDFSGADPGGSGVASFECRLDAGSFAPCTSPQNYTSLDDGSHTFQVRAKDGAGNTDQSPASFTWTVDPDGPDTQIDSGPSGLTNNPSPSFTYSGIPPEDTDHLECHLVGEGAFEPCPTAGKSYTDLDDGEHTFEVRAVDAAANADPTPASRSFTVDSTPPAAPQITATDPDSPANNNHPKLRGQAAGSSTVKLYQSGNCSGTLETQGTAAQFASPGLSASVSDNTHSTFTATATDAAGNTSACSSPLTYVEDSTSTRPGPPPAGEPGAVGLADEDGSVKAEKKSLPLEIACADGQSCDGTLEVKTAKPVALSKKKILTLARATFSIPAGQRAIVDAKLTGKGKKLLKHKRKVKALVTITTEGGGAKSTTTEPLKIKRKKK